MTREEVQQRLDLFLEALGREQAVKEQLLSLKMGGKRATQEDVQAMMDRQNDLIGEVRRIRFEEMLPILEEICKFVAESRPDGTK